MTALPSPPPWTAIVLAGIAAGSVDVFAAAIINHVSPRIVLQAIAGGVLGKATFAGGAGSAILGLVLQWAMSIVIAAILLTASRCVPLLGQHRVAAGLLYGPAVYVVMTFVVVPLSRSTSRPNLSPGHVAADLAAMIVFAVIITTTPAALSAMRSPSVRTAI